MLAHRYVIICEDKIWGDYNVLVELKNFKNFLNEKMDV